MQILTFQTDYSQPQQPLATVNPLFQPLLNSHSIYIAGDLHGSFVKLISVLIHLQFIQYRGHPMVIYAAIMNCERNLQGKYADRYRRVLPTVLMQIMHGYFWVNAEVCRTKQITFIGDTLCDRGPSDFATLLVFDWMEQMGIQYSVIVGNHDLLLCTEKVFTPEAKRNSPSRIFNHPCFQSFDYFKLPVHIQGNFEKLCLKYVNHLKLFEILFAPDAILLTHAPALMENFIEINEFYKSHGTKHDLEDIFELPSAESERIQNDFHRFVRHIFFRGMKNSHIVPSFTAQFNAFVRVMHKFCWNRDYITIPATNINIFGHMGGCYLSPDGSIVPPPFPTNSICIDRPTGMPGISAGEVVYALV